MTVQRLPKRRRREEEEVGSRIWPRSGVRGAFTPDNCCYKKRKPGHKHLQFHWMLKWYLAHFHIILHMARNLRDLTFTPYCTSSCDICILDKLWSRHLANNSWNHGSLLKAAVVRLLSLYTRVSNLSKLTHHPFLRSSKSALWCRWSYWWRHSKTWRKGHSKGERDSQWQRRRRSGWRKSQHKCSTADNAAVAADVIGAKSFIIMVIQSGKEWERDI